MEQQRALAECVSQHRAKRAAEGRHVGAEGVLAAVEAELGSNALPAAAQQPLLQGLLLLDRRLHAYISTYCASR